jgi:hypothetical protein
MKKVILLILTFFISGYSIAQDCKVLKAEISATYKGECKNGLANGTGTAEGKDSYVGEFKKGFPDGKGVYIWANGAVYRGYMKKGLRNGEGSYVWHTANGDSTLSGLWSNDRYEKYGKHPYIVGRNESIQRYSISKSLTVGNKITFRFMRGGKSCSEVSNLNVFRTSGTDNLNGTYLEIRDAAFPIEMKLTFSVPNLLNSNEINCIFYLTINETASWDVVLNI